MYYASNQGHASLMLLSGSHQAMNLSLPRVEAVKEVAVTRKCWSHTRRTQQILLVDTKNCAC